MGKSMKKKLLLMEMVQATEPNFFLFWCNLKNEGGLGQKHAFFLHYLETLSKWRFLTDF